MTSCCLDAHGLSPVFTTCAFSRHAVLSRSSNSHTDDEANESIAPCSSIFVTYPSRSKHATRARMHAFARKGEKVSSPAMTAAALVVSFRSIDSRCLFHSSHRAARPPTRARVCLKPGPIQEKKAGRFFGIDANFTGLAVIVGSTGRLHPTDARREQRYLRHRDVAIVANNGTRSYDDLMANLGTCSTRAGLLNWRESPFDPFQVRQARTWPR